MTPRRHRGVPANGLSHLRVSLTPAAYMGPGRADLLELIGATGSIASAGKAMGMSYKRAWSLVQALNAGFGQPLVVANRGGSAQGGASLTPAGQEVLRAYRAMQILAGEAIAEEVAAMRAVLGATANPK